MVYYNIIWLKIAIESNLRYTSVYCYKLRVTNSIHRYTKTSNTNSVAERNKHRLCYYIIT